MKFDRCWLRLGYHVNSIFDAFWRTVENIKIELPCSVSSILKDLRAWISIHFGVIFRSFLTSIFVSKKRAAEKQSIDLQGLSIFLLASHPEMMLVKNKNTFLSDINEAGTWISLSDFDYSTNILCSLNDIDSTSLGDKDLDRMKIMIKNILNQLRHY